MQTFDASTNPKPTAENRHSCHRWRRLYGGMKGPEMARMKELEKENARLKKNRGAAGHGHRRAEGS